MSSGKYTYDLFVSYAEANEAWIKGYLLGELGLPKERIITKCDFKPNKPIVNEFERAILSSRYTVLVLSPAYLADEWTVFSEQLTSYARVATRRDRLIPLKREPCDLSLSIEFLVSLNCTSSNPAKWKHEIERLRRLLDQPEPEPEKITCPYPGILPFSEKNSKHFYGRQNKISSLLDNLRRNSLQAVIGPSGSGKSSLVFAGLVPALRQSEGSWLIESLRPDEEPLKELATIFNSDLTNVEQAVADLLAKQANAQRLLLIVDQFEETFTTAKMDQRRPFQEALMRLYKVDGCYLVLTIRAAFYEDLMGSPIWSAIKNRRMEIVPLDGDGLRQAIKCPAEDVGVFIESTLVERLVADAVGEPGILPFLQETLILLWEKRERRYLPLSAYEALALSAKDDQEQNNKPLTGLQVAMTRQADAALAKLADQSPEHEAIARRIFLGLVQFGEGRPDTRRQQPIGRLCSDGQNQDVFNQVIDELAQDRLLTLTGEIVTSDEDKSEKPQQKVDIAHEALITGWPTLQKWLKEWRKTEQTRRLLETKADEWEQLGKGSGGLLDKFELLKYEEWLKESKLSGLPPSKKLKALVKASHLNSYQWQTFFTIAILIVIAIVVWAFYLQASARVSGFQ